MDDQVRRIVEESHRFVADSDKMGGLLVSMTKEQAYTTRMLSALRRLIQHNWNTEQAEASIAGAAMAVYNLELVDGDAVAPKEILAYNPSIARAAAHAAHLPLGLMLSGKINIMEAEAEIKTRMAQLFEPIRRCLDALESDSSDPGAGGDGNGN